MRSQEKGREAMKYSCRIIDGLSYEGKTIWALSIGGRDDTHQWLNLNQERNVSHLVLPLDDLLVELGYTLVPKEVQE